MEKLPSFHKQDVHGSVAHDEEDAAVDGEADGVVPQREHIEAKRAQNRRAGHFDVEAVFLVDEGEVADFVDDETFEAVVEDGELGRTVSIDYIIRR